MSTDLSLVDRLRIERAVWTVDTYLSSLPARRQRAIRRELRANLRASAAQIGARQAIRDLGSLRRLSIDYLSAEYRGRPSPSMLKGLFWVVAVEAVILTAYVVGIGSFINGLEAAGPAPGSYLARWPVFGMQATVTYDTGGEFTGMTSELFLPVLLAWVSGAFVLGSRLWRLIPLMRHRPPRATTPPVPAGDH